MKITISIQKYKENLCNQCPVQIRGKCCYTFTQIIDNSSSWLIPLSKHPCKYLNTKTGRCSIYKKRHLLNPNCLTIKEMILCGTIPKECLYVKSDPNYQKRRDTILLELPNDLSENSRRKYEELNNSPHSEIKVYDTLRTFICPKCESPNLKEEWKDKFSILYFSYQCENCGYKWSNLQKQINYSLKKLNERG